MKPIHINKKVAKTTFQIDNFRNAETATIEITRMGGRDTIIYPALEVTEDTVTFMWDNALYNARSGRYQGIIRIDGCKPFCVPLHLGCKCNMGSSEQGYFTSKECVGC
ncbi:hypothetical protein [Caviibacterium pharyngocola]|uniref:Uncharacterized protein n=1 Tax=Caviibacterium pharyngocola TaxID=28159 RepID=A0A2M8RXY7_9PAST|nr:hypothetical protein [Caviibacterium pharyngocola]PJG83751.1 hypothetical protein CVP04_02515 [Caviibacterium pharyngocola]